jgi:hypothetical protein
MLSYAEPTFADSLSPDDETDKAAPEQSTPWQKEHQRRLRAGMEDYGFYVHDLKELRKVDALRPKPTTPNPVLGYFNMIVQSPHREERDPRTTARRALNTFNGYATDAFEGIIAIQDFEIELHREHILPDAILSEHFPIADWRADAAFITMLTNLSKYVENSEFARTGTYDSLAAPQIIDRTEGEERIERILQDLGDFSIDVLRSICTVAIESEMARLEYWKERIKDAANYAPVRQQSQETYAALASRSMWL